MDLSTLSIDKPDAINFILGQTHFAQFIAVCSGLKTQS
jgi:adenosine/AMP kinase